MELLADPVVTAAAILVLAGAACGLSLYATVGALGLASRIGLIPALPPGLTGLENGLVISTAAALLLVEALADREAAFAGMWHTLHALVKPIAAGLLTFSAIGGGGRLEPGLLAAACALAAASALLLHAMRYGLRVAVRMPNAPSGSLLWTATEAVLALVVLLPLRFPLAVLPAAGAMLLLMAVGGLPGFRAARLGIAAQRARLRSFLGGSGWSPVRRLPRSIRARVAETPLGGTPPRAVRAGVLSAAGIGRFQRGWLLEDSSGHRLLARTWRGVRQVAIPPDAGVSVDAGTWGDLLRIDTERGEFRILLLKDGPAPALVTRSLRPEPALGSRVPF